MHQGRVFGELRHGRVGNKGICHAEPVRFAQDHSPFESLIPLVNCYLPVKRRVKLIKNARTIPREN